MLPFRFRSVSVFLPLCGNLGWSFRVSFAKCHVMLPLRFRCPSVSLPIGGWTNRFKSLTSHGHARAVHAKIPMGPHSPKFVAADVPKGPLGLGGPFRVFPSVQLPLSFRSESGSSLGVPPLEDEGGRKEEGRSKEVRGDSERQPERTRNRLFKHLYTYVGILCLG